MTKILRTCYNCIFPFLGTDFSEAVFNEELANAATKTATELEENVSLWTKVFNFSEGLADALGFVGSLAGCVVIGFQIFRDFKEGAPVAQKALDICQVQFPSIILSEFWIGRVHHEFGFENQFASDFQHVLLITN